MCNRIFNRRNWDTPAIEHKMEKLKELYINDLITLEEYRADHAALKDQLEKVIDLPAAPQPKDLSKVKSLLSQDFRGIYDGMTIPEKSAFWRSFVAEIRIDKERNISVIFL